MTVQVIIVTGLSGAGKSTAIKCFEDLGFFCIDNLPPALIPRFLDLCLQNEDIHRVALGIDVRERVFLDDFLKVYNDLKTENHDRQLLYLEAENEVLLRRFSETRRKHPLGEGRTLREAIQLEREKLAPLKEIADRLIDTSDRNVHQLKELITELFLTAPKEKVMNLTLVSFGYRHGIPPEADLVFDVRFLPNPHFVAELAPLTGLDSQVVEFVMNREVTGRFLDRLEDFFDFLIPHYLGEGKAYLTIALGCTGGQHRSVVLINHLEKHFTDRGFSVNVAHRDLDRR